MREESLLTLNYQSLYLIRRYAITASIVFLWDPVYQLIQINGFILGTLAFTTYTASKRPFKDRDLYSAELINEFLLLLTSYGLFYYSDFNNQKGFNEFKYNVGWIMIGLIITLIAFNMYIILKKIISIVKNKFKDRIAEQKRKYAYRYSIEEKEKIEHERLRQIKEIRAGMGPRNDLNIFHDKKYDTLGHNPILLGREGDSRITKKYARDMINNQTRL